MVKALPDWIKENWDHFTWESSLGLQNLQARQQSVKVFQASKKGVFPSFRAQVDMLYFEGFVCLFDHFSSYKEINIKYFRLTGHMWSLHIILCFCFVFYNPSYKKRQWLDLGHGPSCADSYSRVCGPDIFPGEFQNSDQKMLSNGQVGLYSRLLQ